MLSFLASKDLGYIVVYCIMRQEDFSVWESTTVVSSLSLEFLGSEGLEAGPERAAVEGELFSRFMEDDGRCGYTVDQLWISTSGLVGKQTLGMNHLGSYTCIHSDQAATKKSF